MGTKMAASFDNIFIAEDETDIINQNPNKPLIWERYNDDSFSMERKQRGNKQLHGASK